MTDETKGKGQTPSLRPREQFVVVTASAALTTAFLALAAYVSRWDLLGGADDFNLPTFYWLTEVVTIAVIAVVALFPMAARAAAIVLKEAGGQTAPPVEEPEVRDGGIRDSIAGRFAMSEAILRTVGARGFSWVLWSFTALQFVLLGLLILRTGGMEASPYTAVVLTFLALGPTVMIGKKSVLVLAVAAVVYCTGLYVLSSEWSATQSIPGEMGQLHALVTIGTVTVSLVIAWYTKVLKG